VQENMDGVRRAPTDWSRCESRHARARAEENLGHKRPLTAWQDGSGKTQLPDWAWGDWADAQTERVCDLMDISLLRLAKSGVDISEGTISLSIWVRLLIAFLYSLQVGCVES
jgi:hypothetical protein